jgi:hypothetical protein
MLFQDLPCSLSFDNIPSKTGFGFHWAWFLPSPLPLASKLPGSLFIGIHITGLQLGVTPTHSSTFIEISGSLLWGNPAYWVSSSLSSFLLGISS